MDPKNPILIIKAPIVRTAAESRGSQRGDYRQHAACGLTAPKYLHQGQTASSLTKPQRHRRHQHGMTTIFELQRPSMKVDELLLPRSACCEYLKRILIVSVRDIVLNLCLTLPYIPHPVLKTYFH